MKTKITPNAYFLVKVMGLNNAQNLALKANNKAEKYLQFAFFDTETQGISP